MGTFSFPDGLCLVGVVSVCFVCVEFVNLNHRRVCHLISLNALKIQRFVESFKVLYVNFLIDGIVNHRFSSATFLSIVHNHNMLIRF